MFTFIIRSGEILLNGDLFAHGHAGWDDGDGIAEPGEGYNDPSMQKVRNIGPLPVGFYSISLPFTHPTIGRLVMRLEPLPGTDTFGRSGFLWHGGGLSSSQGCLVSSLQSRELAARHVLDGERILEVIAEPPLKEAA